MNSILVALQIPPPAVMTGLQAFCDPAQGFANGLLFVLLSPNIRCAVNPFARSRDNHAVTLHAGHPMSPWSHLQAQMPQIRSAKMSTTKLRRFSSFPEGASATTVSPGTARLRAHASNRNVVSCVSNRNIVSCVFNRNVVSCVSNRNVVSCVSNHNVVSCVFKYRARIFVPPCVYLSPLGLPT